MKECTRVIKGGAEDFIPLIKSLEKGVENILRLGGCWIRVIYYFYFFNAKNIFKFAEVEELE